MARRRPAPAPDADRIAALEEAETIEKLAGYYMRAFDPPIPGAAEACGDVGDILALARKHRGHPAAAQVLSTFESTAKMREGVPA